MTELPDAEAISSIQPFTTPQNRLPLSEETLANADGELPTVSATLNQTTIVTEAAQYGRYSYGRQVRH